MRPKRPRRWLLNAEAGAAVLAVCVREEGGSSDRLTLIVIVLHTEPMQWPPQRETSPHMSTSCTTNASLSGGSSRLPPHVRGGGCDVASEGRIAARNT